MARVILAFLLVLVATVAVHPTAAVDLRVGCRAGQPPFIDAPDLTIASCQGLLFEVFKQIIDRTNYSYTMGVVQGSAMEPFIQVDPTTNTSQYDLLLAFHTVTPSRLLVHDFSVAMFQSDDSVALDPKFQKSGGSLVDAVIRKAVLYVFSIFAISFMFMAIVILLFEPWHEDAEINELPWWRKFLGALQQGVEVIFTFSTSMELQSQVVRMVRSVIACVGCFIIAIFGAVLTSQLTVASVTVVPTYVTQLDGRQIAIASSTLVPYLTGKQVNARTVSVPNLDTFAKSFYAGEQPDFDGFCTSTEVVAYLHNKYGAARNGFTVTPNFQKSGSYELKGLPISHNLDRKYVDRINRELQILRESGTLATLIAKFVKKADAVSPPDDIPVNSDNQTGIATVVGLGFGLMLLGSFVLLIKHKVMGSSADAADEEEAVLEWRGVKYAGLTKGQMAVLDAMANNGSD